MVWANCTRWFVAYTFGTTSPKSTIKKVTAPTCKVQYDPRFELGQLGNRRSITTVEIRMMTMLTRLFRTKIVASKWRGARSESGRFMSSMTR